MSETTCESLEHPSAGAGTLDVRQTQSRQGRLVESARAPAHRRGRRGARARGSGHLAGAPDRRPLRRPAADDATGHGVFLLDLQKPLARGHAPLPGRLLRDVTLDLAAHTELEVFTLTDYAEAPRIAARASVQALR